MPALTPEEMYLELDRLVAEMPELAQGEITPEKHLWLGRAAALIEMLGNTGETVKLQVASERLHGILREDNAASIVAIVNRALAKARLAVPAYQGEFLAAKSPHSALAAVAKILRTAKADVFMVDPHADDKVLDDFAQSAPDGVAIRILAKTNYKQSLRVAAQRWIQQYGKNRSLEVLLVPADTLHNRLIMVDGKTAWELGQSFNDLAGRSHMSVIPVPPQMAAQEIAAYEKLWAQGSPLPLNP
jgi:hypothetical protein